MGRLPFFSDVSSKPVKIIYVSTFTYTISPNPFHCRKYGLYILLLRPYGLFPLLLHKKVETILSFQTVKKSQSTVITVLSALSILFQLFLRPTFEYILTLIRNISHNDITILYLQIIYELPFQLL